MYEASVMKYGELAQGEGLLCRLWRGEVGAGEVPIHQLQQSPLTAVGFPTWGFGNGRHTVPHSFLHPVFSLQTRPGLRLLIS